MRRLLALTLISLLDSPAAFATRARSLDNGRGEASEI